MLGYTYTAFLVVAMILHKPDVSAEAVKARSISYACSQRHILKTLIL
jgi:hypothetical protein